MKTILSKANLTQTPSVLLMAGGLSLLAEGRVYEGVFCILAGAALQELKYRKYSKTTD